MKFAILGAGGVGGYYGGLLAKNGHEVCVLARTSNLAALQERGLEVRTAEGSFIVAVKASDTVKDFSGRGMRAGGGKKLFFGGGCSCSGFSRRTRRIDCAAA